MEQLQVRNDLQVFEKNQKFVEHNPFKLGRVAPTEGPLAIPGR